MEFTNLDDLVDLDVVYDGQEHKIRVTLNDANVILNDPVRADQIVENALGIQRPEANRQRNDVIWSKRRGDDVDRKATEDFINLRIKYNNSFVKRKVSHSTIFNNIARELIEKGYNLGPDPGKKCIQKFNNLQKIYMQHRDHMRATGAEHKEPPPFYDLLHSLLGRKDKSCPTNLLDSEIGTVQNNSAMNSAHKNRDNKQDDKDNDFEMLNCDEMADNSEERLKEEAKPSTSTSKIIRNRFQKRVNNVPQTKTSQIVKSLKEEMENCRRDMNTNVSRMIQQENEHFQKTHEQREVFLKLMNKLVKKGKKRPRSPSTSSSESE